jgi:competence ComEA-like helix-hairpin-helix protein
MLECVMPSDPEPHLPDEPEDIWVLDPGLKAWLGYGLGALVLVGLLFLVLKDSRRPPEAVTQKLAATEAADTRVNLNTATQQELESLPGIGPVMARAIIARRPFRAADELDHVSGIGAKRLATLLPLVKVTPPP